MTTRKGLVAKKRSFSRKNDDEKRSRRQKKGVSRAKTTTRKGLVAKNERFSPQNGDEKESRRQKREFPAKNDDEKRSRRQKKEFPAQKRRREKVSSLKKVPHTKLSARVSLIGKK
ncbi:hypothetical protein NSQ14_04045 [Caldifermentibacillus hisashii]|uniref:hypothetical protein n=1 Tax=Caldifermentibacillus hisashii TaxID=996558 RepID=UPI0031FE2437